MSGLPVCRYTIGFASNAVPSPGRPVLAPGCLADLNSRCTERMTFCHFGVGKDGVLTVGRLRPRLPSLGGSGTPNRLLEIRDRFETGEFILARPGTTSRAPGMMSWMLKPLSTRTATNPHPPPLNQLGPPGHRTWTTLSMLRPGRHAAPPLCETTKRPTTRRIGPFVQPSGWIVGGPQASGETRGGDAPNGPPTSRTVIPYERSCSTADVRVSRRGAK